MVLAKGIKSFESLLINSVNIVCPTSCKPTCLLSFLIAFSLKTKLKFGSLFNPGISTPLLPLFKSSFNFLNWSLVLDISISLAPESFSFLILSSSILSIPAAASLFVLNICKDMFKPLDLFSALCTSKLLSISWAT